ncbi:MAG: lipopolysaccharide biosynthesis protein [Advenella sp.]|nr:lipopolysaccharide biosynthesis protein [Advenella sp.]
MSLKKQAISGVKWSFAQQFSVQIINFGVQVILARLLMPEMFGLIAMVIVFISIGSALMDSGMTSSLIRTKNPDQTDYSTVFVTNLLVSFAVYILIFILAPYIADFYNQDVLTNIIRLLALSFVIRAFVAVHVAKLTKEMNFKLQMQLQVPSVIISGIIGVTMAYKGYGVWSLVWLNIAQALVFTIQYWVFIPWKPSLVFDKERFKYHFKFGYKLTLSSLLDSIYNDAYRIVIGKCFSPAQVGYFNQAETMRLFPVQQISTVVGKITYPYFANIESDVSLRRAYKNTMKLLIFITLPTMLSLILIAEEGFRFVFGEKWLPSVPYFQVLALASIVRPVSTYNLNILKVKGRSDIFLQIEIIKKILGVIFLIGGLLFGIMGLVISLVSFAYISYAINMSYSGKLINYSAFSQLKDISTMVLLAVFLYTTLYTVKNTFQFNINSEIILIVFFSSTLFGLFIFLSILFDKELKSIIINLKN